MPWCASRIRPIHIAALLLALAVLLGLGHATLGAASLEEVASASRIPNRAIEVNRFPGNVTIVTADDIKRWRPATVQQLLSRLEGVTFSDQQGFGLSSNATVNLRGVVNSARTNALVLVDGIRQNRFTGDEVHWQSIPVDQIERIEVIRGGGGLIYGEGALAGVINIFTKQEDEALLEAEESAEMGSFGWQKYTVGVRGRAKALRYGVHHTRRLVDGYRESSESRNATLRARTGLDVADGISMDLRVTHSDDTTAFPGLLTLAQSQQRQEQTNAFHGFNTTETDQVALDTLIGPFQGFSSVLSVFWGRRVQTSEDSIAFNSFTITPSRGMSLRTIQEWTGSLVHNLLASGVELGEDKATTGDPGAGPDNETNRAGYGMYLEDTVTVADRLSLVGGVRFDKSRYETSLSFPDYNGTLRFEGWSPRLGVSYIVVPKRLRLFAAYARPFKSPNVDDFSSRVSTIARSNADLLPQQADTYEAGVAGSAKGLQASATGFFIRTKDEILYNNLSFINENYDTRRVGWELSLRTESAEGPLRSYATYTFVDGEFREGQFAGRTIPGAPEHTLHTGVGVSPVKGLWLDLDWSLVHDAVRVNDFNNILGGADNYGVLNCLVQYDLPRRARRPELSVYLRIENLTNEEYVTYQSSNSSNLLGAGEAPMPPIGFTGGVSIKF